MAAGGVPGLGEAYGSAVTAMVQQVEGGVERGFSNDGWTSKL